MIKNEKCPPNMGLFNFSIDNVKLLGVILLAKGCNPHPTVLLLHGFPGYEKNFDIAHILRNSGYNTIVFHYRGSWGSGGSFSFSHVIEDTLYTYNLLKSKEISNKYHIDTKNISIIGHSMGGFAALMAGAKLTDTKKIASISGVNFGYMIKLLMRNNRYEEIEKFLASQTIDPLSETNIYKLRDELIRHKDEWDILNYIDTLKDKDLFLIGAKYDRDVPIKHHHNPLVEKLYLKGAKHVRDLIMETDHLYSDMRFELSRILLNWLNT